MPYEFDSGLGSDALQQAYDDYNAIWANVFDAWQQATPSDVDEIGFWEEVGTAIDNPFTTIGEAIDGFMMWVDDHVVSAWLDANEELIEDGVTAGRQMRNLEYYTYEWDGESPPNPSYPDAGLPPG